MIDEVQDYTVAQLAVLARYFKRAHFLLLGDQNQAIAPGTATFDQVRALFPGGARPAGGVPPHDQLPLHPRDHAAVRQPAGR